MTCMLQDLLPGLGQYCTDPVHHPIMAGEDFDDFSVDRDIMI